MARQLSILNANPQLLPGPSLLHGLLNAESNALAIDFERQDGVREQVSSRELHARSDALAARLLAHRNTPKAHRSTRFIVPLYIPQSPDLYISQLAVLKAGGAYCPIALDVPAERLRFILHDVEADILLTTSDVSSQLPPLDMVKAIAVDTLESYDLLPTSHIHIEPSQAAYIM